MHSSGGERERQRQNVSGNKELGLKMGQVQGPGWLKALLGREDGMVEGCELCRGSGLT